METRAPKGTEGTCLIAGCGYVGARLARRLQGSQPVLALVRSVASAEALIREGIPTLPTDFEGGTPELPPGLHSVVYLAPPSETGVEDVRLVGFLEALGPARPEVLVYVSTTGVYGDTDGASVSEDSPTAPREDRSRRRLDAEGRAAHWCAARGLRCVVFRVPAIYGPWRLPLERLRQGEPVLRTEDSGPGNRIHVDDLVGACLEALERPVAGVFNLTDGHPEDTAAFMTRVARLADLPAPPQVRWAEAQGLISPGMLGFLRESRLVLSDRMTKDLRLRLRYADPEDGIRASLTEMGL